jgi:hypothetical protein
MSGIRSLISTTSELASVVMMLKVLNQSAVADAVYLG